MRPASRRHPLVGAAPCRRLMPPLAAPGASGFAIVPVKLDAIFAFGHVMRSTRFGARKDQPAPAAQPTVAATSDFRSADSIRNTRQTSGERAANS